LFSYLLTADEFGHRILVWIDGAAVVIEVLAVLLIIAPIFYAVGHYLFQAALHPEIEDLYRQLRVRLGKALLLGLEILVAADIVRTVALEATLESILTLGLLILVRTFLGWSLTVEIEGRWPWQREQEG
jgi:uncharacterized membrane protein